MKALLLAAAAALSLAGAAAAQAPGPARYAGQAGPEDFARFDARVGDDLARKLAICDATRFLASDPDLDADRVYVRRDQGIRYDLLLPPYFVDGFQWYDEDIERAYRRLRRQDAVGYEEVRAARQFFGREMVKTIDRVGAGERGFLRDQSRYCDTVEDLGRG